MSKPQRWEDLTPEEQASLKKAPEPIKPDDPSAVSTGGWLKHLADVEVARAKSHETAPLGPNDTPKKLRPKPSKRDKKPQDPLTSNSNGVSGPARSESSEEEVRARLQDEQKTRDHWDFESNTLVSNTHTSKKT